MAPMVVDVDRELFLRQGYLILDIIPQQQLPAVRDAFEDLAWRQREQEGGWATTAQPRFTLDLLGAFDAPTAAALELAVGSAVRDVSAQLLQCAEPLLANCQMFVEPQHEPPPPPEPGAMSAEGSAGTDPRNWHRDLRPDHNGPLRLLQEANAVDGPAYVQWNICLHDQGDAHLSIVPTSHNRLTTADEKKALDRSPTAPLPGSICAELAPGTGVVYTTLLHHGERYTPTQPRRTLHFGFERMPLTSEQETAVTPPNGWAWRPGVRGQLSDRTQRAVEVAAAGQIHRLATLERICRAAIRRDAKAFEAELGLLYPSAERDGVIHQHGLVKICKYAQQMTDAIPEEEDEEEQEEGEEGGRAVLDVELPLAIGDGRFLGGALADRFSAAELRTLSSRFAALDAALRVPASEPPKHVRGFLGSACEYEYETMRQRFGVAELVRSWGEQPRL